MKKYNKKYSYFSDKITLVSVLIGLLLCAAVFLVCTKYETSEGNRTITETLEFMKMQCLRYDNLTASNQAEDQIHILDKAKELGRCLDGTASSETEDFLENYARGQRLSGVFLLDKNGELQESICLDDTTYSDWEETLQDKNLLNVMEYPQKSYLSSKQGEDGLTYDYAAISQSSGESLIFCYARRQNSETDEMSIGLDNLLSGYHLEMDGLILITDGTTILSSNEEALQGMEISSYPLLANHVPDISSGRMTMIKEDGTIYLSRHNNFRSYYLYVFFPAKSVFQKRSAIIAYVLVLYVLLLLLISIIRQREAQNTNQLKMQFLRQMSHDIRTPINGIRGMVQIGNSFPYDMEKQQECRDKIWDASGFLIELVNDVLDMGKLEAGEIKLETKPFHLQKLIQNELEVTKIQAREKGIRVQLGEMNVNHWNLIGSPIHIQRILSNLLINAVKYNVENGSVTLSCREFETNADTGQVLFEFICADTGIGMSREFQKHMFEQFAQENTAGEISYHGTGLGLPIVKSLVQEMGGKIRCESERHKGTTFYVTLPFVIDSNPETADNGIENAETDVSLRGTSILLVEDNDLNMEIAEFLLEDEGAVIQKAWNGQEAVQIFADSSPGQFQLILMDVMMPVMDGETAARTIRALDREDAKTIPIIAMTANAFADDIDSAIQSGMNAHIAKPIDLEQLKKTIHLHI